MPTIKDIAKAAGVSHGTVSNVLTGKGNVSAEKIRLVKRFAKEMGYMVNESAKTLRSQSAKEFAIIMPNITMEQNRDIYIYAKRYFEENGYDVRLYLTNNLIENDINAINKSASDRLSGIVCVPSELCGKNPYNEYRGLPVVIAEYSPDLFNVVQIGFDNKKCGEEIGCYIKVNNYKEVLIFVDQTYRYEAVLLQRIREYLSERAVILHIVDIASADGFLSVINLLVSCSGIDLILTMNIEQTVMAQSAGRLSGRDLLPPVLTVASSSIIRGGSLIHYELDYKQLGVLAAKKILQMTRGEEVSSQLLTPDGFRGGYTKQIHTGSHQVRMLTINSPTSRILSGLAPLCKKQTGIDLILTILEQRELYDTALSSVGSGFFDIIRLDVIWFTEIASQLFIPLDETGHDFSKIKSRLLHNLPDYYSIVDDVSYALPFDPSVMLLFYRKDLFSDQIIKRMYYEQMNSSFDVPKNFADYNKIARFFTRAYNPDSPTKYGITMAMGSSYSVACEFIPRLYEYSCGLQCDLLSCIDAREAIEGFFDSFNYSSREPHSWWRDSAREFALGQAAMSVMFMNYASDIIKNMETDLQKRIGIAAIPGKASVLGGGIAGFMQGTPNISIACEFMEWVYSDETSKLITYLGGNSPCGSVYDNCEILHRYPWMEVGKNSFSSAVRNFTGKKDISERYFENVIGLAIRNAALGHTTVEEAVRYIKYTLDS